MTCLGAGADTPARIALSPERSPGYTTAMRYRPLATLLLLLLAPVGAHAQDILLEPLDRQPRPVYAADGLMAADKLHEKIDCGRWRTDIVFGLPIAVRVQRQVTDTGLWIEGGAAVYGFVPSVFVGARFDARIYEGRDNSWFVRPGVDMYFSPISGDGGWLFPRFNGMAALTVDADLSWQHRWADRLHGNLGLKLGLGVGVAGRSVFPLPILGLTYGLQY